MPPVPAILFIGDARDSTHMEFDLLCLLARNQPGGTIEMVGGVGYRLTLQ
ncbi:MAG TPA: hypothetical protein VHP14_00295 [Anaerolineales bacterium]|nr:hypothetical protein [Anaerolineales bacterium]